MPGCTIGVVDGGDQVDAGFVSFDVFERVQVQPPDARRV